jgi:TonB family protein
MLESHTFDAPALLVEARYRRRTLCARLLRADARGSFTIGGGRRADAPIDPRYLPPGLPANDNHTLVAPTAAGFIIDLPPAMREHAERSASRLRIPCGEVVFDISAAAPAPPVPRSWLRAGWADDARITGAVALGMLLLLLLVRAVPEDPHALSLDDVGKNLRFHPGVVIPPAVVQPPPPKDARGSVAGGGGPNVAASGLSGTAGDPKAHHADARRATRGPAKNQDARDVEAYVVENTILSVLNGPHTTAVATVFDNTRALGDHEKEVLGNLVAMNIGEAWGHNGLGPTGTGAGGGDPGRPMIGGGDGRLITRGLRHGPGGPGLDDHGGGSLGRRQARVPEFSGSILHVRGNLDKEIIRRTVRQHLNEVRFCYEEELARKPSLAGRVVTQFTIGPTGKVIVSVLQSSTLSAPAVESCVVAATRRWQYPAPDGGGIVTVTYPFQLAPAGG